MRISSENIVEFIADIFQRKGSDSYLGESVTMSQHMLQGALQAEKNGADDEIVAAALLHDIGHYTSEFPADMVGVGQDNYHEEAGARLLAPFFTQRVVSCVRYHVPAKRYLCVIDQTYYDDLSDASKHTLELQGGLMSPEEMQEFAATPFLDDILQVRRWDDLAKDPLQETPPFSYYQPILKRLVEAGNAKEIIMDTVSFTEMKHGTHADYAMLHEMEKPFMEGTARRLISEMARQGEETIGGYKVTRLGHALQSATTAYRDGVEVDWIVAALLHDIGDGLSPQNHDRMAAEILRPFVREEVTWTIEHHGAFQMIYYAQHYEGWNQFEREKYADSPYYQSCVDFCEYWDQGCFDPEYDVKPLEFFVPMVEEVFARKAYSPEVLQAGVVKGLGRKV